MFRKKRNPGGSGKTPHEGGKPTRDAYDWLIFAVQVAGVLAVVATIVVTLSLARSSGRDTAKAIDTMANIASTLEKQQAAIINQSEATVNLASETNTVAVATKTQADAAADNAKTAQQQLATANKQLSQNITLFEAQHRPIMTMDLMGEHNRLSVSGNLVFWDFDFKNVGNGPAYNVFYYEAISINGGPFHEHERIGSKLDPPNTPHWSTAIYAMQPGEVYAKPALRVRFVYSDVLGERYEDVSCVRYQGLKVTRDCTEPQRPNPGRKKPKHG